MKRIGILAFHGDVSEHVAATQAAAKKLGLAIATNLVRGKADLKSLDGLIIPGGESTTLQKLCEREGMWEDIKKIKNIFGTCAGAILLSKTVFNKMPGQKTLGLMNTAVDRNAYGRQNESFEKNLETSLGRLNALFIRAPKIHSIGKNIKILAQDGNTILACEERKGDSYYLATCFHPELDSTLFHEHFLRNISA
ncbi:MAG: pyridoxal 5'-phosphate synthase glutaminase subunit PdxT [bacterium]|nr:pyridoxal 5'-phosphate synthase glutaminase subunit PdxT [bacterium]